LGRHEEAVDAAREAIRLRPDYAEAYCNLGSYLQNLARFEESRAAYRRGHELGSKREGWPYPSAKWVEVSEALVKFDENLARVMRGDASPADLRERGAFLSICRLRKLWGWRARLFKDVFELQPSTAADQRSHNRYNAACAAVLAGTGQGNDADSLNAADRKRWREQALEWLRADLAVWKKALADDAGEQARKNAAQMLAHALEDAELSGIRDAEAIATLPEEEQTAWSTFWEQVRAVHAASQGK
jgi:serine/threonine-protein kinase